jgi:hypothetical protein
LNQKKKRKQRERGTSDNLFHENSDGENKGASSKARDGSLSKNFNLAKRVKT